MINNTLLQIYENELEWLKSIGCKVQKNSYGKYISSDILNANDFTYYMAYKLSNEIFLYNNIKIDDKNKYYKKLKKLLIKNNYVCEKTYDINLIATPNSKNKLLNLNNNIILNKDMFLKVSNKKEWAIELYNKKRHFNENIKPFFIVIDNNMVGKVCLIKTKCMLGIYDLQIFKQYRGKNYSTKIISELLLFGQDINYFFIQTWSENIPAVNSYKKSGFIEISRVMCFKSKI